MARFEKEMQQLKDDGFDVIIRLFKSQLWAQILLALVLGVDRILEMYRTSVNVTGDLVATTVMQKWLVR